MRIITITVKEFTDNKIVSVEKNISEVEYNSYRNILWIIIQDLNNALDAKLKELK
jgi:hypothetical protein